MKYLLLLLVLFTACRTPQQKLNRLLKKYPELQATRIDTLTRTDTIYRDTLVQIPADSAVLELPDTATSGTITQGRATIRYIRVPGKTIRIDCKCDSLQLRLRLREITKTLQINTQQTIIKEVERKKGFFDWLMYWLAFLGIIAVLLFFATKRLRR